MDVRPKIGELIMILVNEQNIEKYNEFLKKHDRCNFQQSIEWGEVKASNWKNEIVLAEDENGNIIGSISVLIRKIPVFGNIMYSSRGPVCDIHDEEVLKQLTDGLKQLSDGSIELADGISEFNTKAINKIAAQQTIKILR